MSSMDDHRELLKQISLLDAGLLTEEEETAVLDHSRTCAGCREVLNLLAAEKGEKPEAPGHIPSAILARWDRMKSTVHGLERELLERHLAGCESCRQELDLLAEETVAGQEGASSGGGVLRLDPHLRRRAWFQGAVAGAALAAAAVLVVLRLPSPDTGPETLPWVAPGTTRGSAQEVVVSPGARRLLLALENPRFPAAAKVTLTVTGPSGDELMEEEVSPELLRSSTVMAVLAVSSDLLPGLYQVSFAAEGQEPRNSSFRVDITQR